MGALGLTALGPTATPGRQHFDVADPKVTLELLDDSQWETILWFPAVVSEDAELCCRRQQ
jgi:hypothetical protein